MANDFGIIEATKEELGDPTSNVNSFGPASGGSAREDTEWNQVVTVRCTDHPSDGGPAADTDVTKMALFSNKKHLEEWVLGGSVQGSYELGEDVIQPDLSSIYPTP